MTIRNRLGKLLQRRVIIFGLLVLSAAVVTAGMVWWPRPRVATRKSDVPPPRLPPKPSAPPDRPVARVGSRVVMEKELARFRAVRGLVTGVGDTGRALEDVCDRVLLGLLANERGITLTQGEIEQETLRRKILIGALASVTPPSLIGSEAGFPRPSPVAPTPWRHSPPGMGGSPWGSMGRPRVAAMPPSPWMAADRQLTEAGLSSADLIVEVQANLLAEKVLEEDVYKKINIPESEVRKALRDTALKSTQVAPGQAPDPRAQKEARPQKDPHAEKEARAQEEARAQKAMRRRMQRERGEAPRAALLLKLRERWPVQIIASSAEANGSTP